MAIAVAQAVVNSSSFGGSGTSLAVTLTVSAGSTLVVWFAAATDGVSTTFAGADSRNAGNYSDGSHIHAVVSGTDFSAYRFYKTGCAAGSTTVTVTFSNSVAAPMMWVEEVTGSDGNAPLASGGQVVTSPGTSADAISSGTLSNASQPAGIVGFALDAILSAIPSAGTGFTSSGSDATTDSRVEFKRVTATGSNPATFTTANGTDTFFVLAYIFAEAGGGGSSGTLPTASGADRRPAPRPRTDGADVAPPLVNPRAGISATGPERRRDVRPLAPVGDPAPPLVVRGAGIDASPQQGRRQAAQRPFGGDAAPVLVSPSAGTLASVSDVLWRPTARIISAPSDVAPPLPSSGGGPPMTGLRIWLRADAGVSTSGSNVSAMADQSGNGNNYSTAAGTPALLSPGAGVNGLPAIRFTDAGGSQQTCYLSATIDPSSWVGFTVIYVARTSATTNLATTFNVVFATPHAAGIWWQFGLSNDTAFGGGYQSGWAGTNSGVTLGAYSPLIGNGETVKQAYAYDKAHWSLSGRLTNTVADTSFPTGPILSCLGSGVYPNTQGSNDFCELLVYDHAATAGELAQVATWLNRWFIASTAGTLADTTPAIARPSSRPVQITGDPVPPLATTTLAPFADAAIGARRTGRVPLPTGADGTPAIAALRPSPAVDTTAPIARSSRPFLDLTAYGLPPLGVPWSDGGSWTFALARSNRVAALAMPLSLPFLPPQTVIVARVPAAPTAAIGLTYTNAVGVTAPTRAQ